MTDSRAKIIEASIDLLRGRGYAGTGINDIVRLSGAPKGSVYHYFPQGKTQIVSEALEGYARSVSEFIESAAVQAADPVLKVQALFEAFATRAEQSGCERSCAVGAVSLDLTSGMEGLRDQAKATLEIWITAIAGALAVGDAPVSRSFAGLVLTCIEGAYVRSRAEQTGEAFREAGRWLQVCLQAEWINPSSKRAATG